MLALGEPLVTASLLARRLDLSTCAGLGLATRLVAAGVLQEMTGRAAWRAFAIALEEVAWRARASARAIHVEAG